MSTKEQDTTHSCNSAFIPFLRGMVKQMEQIAIQEGDDVLMYYTTAIKAALDSDPALAGTSPPDPPVMPRHVLSLCQQAYQVAITASGIPDLEDIRALLGDAIDIMQTGATRDYAADAGRATL